MFRMILHDCVSGESGYSSGKCLGEECRKDAEDWRDTLLRIYRDAVPDGIVRTVLEEEKATLLGGHPIIVLEPSPRPKGDVGLNIRRVIVETDLPVVVDENGCLYPRPSSP